MASRMAATAGVFLSPSRCPPRPGFAPCAYLNSTMRARWIVSSRTPKSPVATCVIMLSLYGINRSGYPPSPVQLNVFHAFAARTLPSCALMFVEPNDMPPPYQGTSIVILGRESFFPFVKKQLGGDVLAAKVWPGFFGKHEPQPVEPAAGIPDFALKIRGRLAAGFGHEPVARKKVRGPAVIAKGLENRAFVERKRLGRTIFHAEVVAFFALKTHAPVVKRTDHLPVAGMGRTCTPDGQSSTHFPHEMHVDARWMLNFPISLR